MVVAVDKKQQCVFNLRDLASKIAQKQIAVEDIDDDCMFLVPDGDLAIGVTYICSQVFQRYFQDPEAIQITAALVAKIATAAAGSHVAVYQGRQPSREDADTLLMLHGLGSIPQSAIDFLKSRFEPRFLKIYILEAGIPIDPID